MNSGTGAKDLRSSSRSGGAVRGEAVLMWLRVTLCLPLGACAIGAYYMRTSSLHE